MTRAHRPIGDIINFILKEFYPVSTMGTIGSSIKYISMLIETIMAVFKAHLVRMDNEYKKRGFGAFDLPDDFMTTVTLSSDLMEFNIPDDALATVIFYTFVRLCPYDDLVMGELNLSKDKETEKPEAAAPVEPKEEEAPVTSRSVTSFHFESGDPSLRTTRIGLANQENQDPHHSAK